MERTGTKYFGDVSYEPDEGVTFPRGLPGFEEETRFLTLEREASRPLVFLQSLRRPDLCFLSISASTLVPGYELSLDPEDARLLGWTGDCGDLVCLALLCLPPDGPPTANLLAPVVIHRGTRQAVQAIQTGSGYSHEHPLVFLAEAPC
jgi:flagellar assembly factor FliW